MNTDVNTKLNKINALELVDAVYKRVLENKIKNTSYNKNFLELVEFIAKNYNNTLENIIAENAYVPLTDTAILNINAKKEKLKIWFEAVAIFLGRNDLKGSDILDYFYNNSISSHGTISNVTDYLKSVISFNAYFENLGELKNNNYTLTTLGKQELVREVYKRLAAITPKKDYYDFHFSIILEFIFKNFNNRLGNLLIKKQYLNDLDETYLCKENQEKLELWFEAVANCFGRDDLKGSDILNYFLSDEYKEKSKDTILADTINMLTKILINSIEFENQEILNSMQNNNIKFIKNARN